MARFWHKGETDPLPGGGGGITEIVQDRTVVLEMLRVLRYVTQGRGRAAVGAMVSCVAVWACDVGTVAIEEAPPIDPVILANARVDILSGDEQEGTVGERLASPLVALVTDEAGSAIAGAPVIWTFGQGRGMSNGNSNGSSDVQMNADAQGRVTIEWELGTKAGPQWASVEISAAAPSGSQDDGPAPAPGTGRRSKADFSARGKPAKGAQIVFSQESLALSVGETASVTAVVVDRYGNIVPDVVIRWVSADSSIVSVGEPAPAPVVQVAERTNPIAEGANWLARGASWVAGRGWGADGAVGPDN